MKNIITLLVFITSFAASAQIINFPDPELKAAVVISGDENGVVDVNGDGEVQISEAEATLTLYLSGEGIDDLTGLEAFVNLQYIYCNFTSISSINLSWFPQLKLANTGANPLLTSVNVTGLSQLVQLELEVCAIDTIIGLPTLSSLKFMDLSENQLTALDLTGLSSLRLIACSNNLLTSIVFPTPNQIILAHVGFNQFTTLDLTALHYVEPNPEGYNGNPENPDINFSYCPNLEYVTIKNGEMDTVNGSSFSNCPSLLYVCADEIEVESFYDLLSSQGTQINSYCTFVPGGEFNTVSGQLSFDLGNDGCDSSDSAMAYQQLQITEGETVRYTYTDADGFYTFYTIADNCSILPMVELPYFIMTPSTAVIDFSTSDTVTQNFCFSANGVHPDLSATVSPTTSARPGFDASYILVYQNNGNQVQSGSISLQFNDSVLDFLSATPAENLQGTNTLSWDFFDLQPSESRTITLSLNLNSPLETPSINNGDQLNFVAAINPTDADETPLDNTSVLNQTVVGSYDPNDKTCIEGATITPEMVGDYLHYIIRFQNSGTFYAENVVVKDVIDSEKFDISTLQLTAASHPHTTRIEGNRVEFIFEGIMLPAEQDDEPGSHGYVAFKIKTKPTLALNDVVENTADIFFDFNFPIVTNTTSTTVSELGHDDLANRTFLIAPNPVKNILRILSEEIIRSVQICDLEGRILQIVSADRTDPEIDFSQYQSGVYLVKIASDKGMKTHKIVKE